MRRAALLREDAPALVRAFCPASVVRRLAVHDPFEEARLVAAGATPSRSPDEIATLGITLVRSTGWPSQLVALTPLARDLSLATALALHEAWMRTLLDLDRPLLFASDTNVADLRDLVPVLRRIGGSAALAEVGRAAAEVVQQIP